MVKRLPILLCLGLFLLLTYKQVYSTRTLVPNLEPYPDAIYYVGTAKSFIEGKGFVLEREGRSFRPSIPSLYSLVLSPIYLFSDSPLNFYYVNVLLGIFSIVLFLLILNKVTNSWLLEFVALFLFVTNYFVYWFPSLAMAENLTLFLFLASLFLWLSKISIVNMVLFGVTISLVMATKFVNFPLTGMFLACYLVRVFLETKRSFKKVGLAAICFALPFAAFLIYENVAKGNNLLYAAVNFVGFVTPVKQIPGATELQALSPQHRWYSLENVSVSLPLYTKALFGGQMRFLWDYTPIVPFYVGTLAMVGFAMGLFVKKVRLLSGMLLSMLVGTISYLSTFYSSDARYIYFAIPTLLVGFALFFSIFLKRLDKSVYKKVAYSALIILFVVYVGSSAVRVKKQISLNLKYAETPWTYVAILELGKTLQWEDPKKTVVISAIAPYLFDYYLDQKFILLPLSSEQEFRDRKVEAWGKRDYSDFIALYKPFVEQGYNVYLEKYGLGNEFYLHRAFEDVALNFDLELISNGCFEVCSVYKLHLKDE